MRAVCRRLLSLANGVLRRACARGLACRAARRASATGRFSAATAVAFTNPSQVRP